MIPSHFAVFNAVGRSLGIVLSLAAALVASTVHADPIAVQWKTPVASPGSAYKPREFAAPQVAADGRTLWLGTSAGVTALDAKTGGLIWQTATAEAVVGQPLAVAMPGEVSPTIFVATMAGAVYALDHKTGQPRWPQPSRLNVPVRSPLAADDRYLYVVADPASVQALDPRTGKPVWRWSTVVDREYLIEGQGGALARDGVVYVGSPTGKLVALSTRDGALLWETALENRARSQYGDVDSTPLWVVGPGLNGVGKASTSNQPMLLATSHSGGLCAVAPADGKVLWRYEIEGLGQPVLTPLGVVVLSALGELHLVDLRGQGKLARKLTGATAGVATWVGDGAVLVPTETGLDLLRLTDGRTLQHVAAELGFAGAPLSLGGTGGPLAYLTVALSNSGNAYGLAVRLDAPGAASWY